MNFLTRAFTTRIWAVVVIATAGTGLGFTRAAATPTPLQPPTFGRLQGVTATAAQAWAVGSTQTGRTLVDRWLANAPPSDWHRVPSPSPGSQSSLDAVAAASPSNVWAAGSTLTVSSGGTASANLVEHWNGKSWATVHVPDPGSFDSLDGVAWDPVTATWYFVGNHKEGTFWKPQLLVSQHGSWKEENLPGSPTFSVLRGVTSLSNGELIAVGSTGLTPGTPLVVTLVGNLLRTTSLRDETGQLDSVAASSPTNVWAVGEDSTSHPEIVRFTRGLWRRSPSPILDRLGALQSVSAASTTSVWAVGETSTGTSTLTSFFAVHWDGTRWTVAPSLVEPAPSALTGVYVVPSTVGAQTKNRISEAGFYGIPNRVFFQSLSK